jgi:hypothetical protein
MIYGRALYGNEQCDPKGGSYPDQCPQGNVFWQLIAMEFCGRAPRLFFGARASLASDLLGRISRWCRRLGPVGTHL